MEMWVLNLILVKNTVWIGMLHNSQHDLYWLSIINCKLPSQFKIFWSVIKYNQIPTEVIWTPFQFHEEFITNAEIILHQADMISIPWLVLLSGSTGVGDTDLFVIVIPRFAQSIPIAPLNHAKKHFQRLIRNYKEHTAFGQG